MSFKDNLYNNLRLKPYITFDNDEYFSKLFSFDGSISTDDKIRFMFIFDNESQQFIWSNDLKNYVADNFGTLVYKAYNVRSLIFEKPTFKIIIVDLYDTYMVVTKYDLISLYYKSDGGPVFNYKSSEGHLLFYDSKSIKRKRYTKKKTLWYDLPLMMDFDFVGGQLFSNVPEFALINQILKERQFLVDTSCRIKGDLTYSQILAASSYRDILKTKYKIFDKVNRSVSLNKINYWEFGLIRQLMLHLTDSEFNAVMRWYNDSGRDLCLKYWNNIEPINYHVLLWCEIYYVYLADKFNVTIDQSGYHSFDDFDTIKRYVDEHLFGYDKLKFDSSHIKTFDDFNLECNLLIVKNNNLMMKRRYYGRKIDKKKWRPLLSKINKADVNLKPLCSVSAIVKNAINNYVNCGSYIGDVIAGNRFVFNYNDGYDDYTLVVSKPDDNRYKVIDVWRRSKIGVGYYQLDLTNVQPVIDLINA